jgi:adenylate kinase family enzyme
MLTPESLARVAIVGTSCAGKSTLGHAFATRLNVPHIELDAQYWGPNWTPVPAEQFRKNVDALTSRSRWVCDGNYSVVRDIIWPCATMVVWLNYSFARVFGRGLRRTLQRCVSRSPMFGGNRETFRLSFLSRDSILLWLLKTHWRHQREYPRQFADPANGHLKIVELKNNSEADRFLDEASHNVADASETALSDDKR